jgi:hypothetical protein
MCIGIQWIFSIILSMPTFFISVEVEKELNFILKTKSDLFFFIIRNAMMIFHYGSIFIHFVIILGIMNTLIFVYTYTSTRRTASAENTTRNVPLTNRDSRVLKHMIFMFLVYITGWTPIYFCIVFQPSWFNFLIFDFMQLMPQLSMLIDIINLFIYNHELRNYFNRKILTMRRHMGIMLFQHVQLFRLFKYNLFKIDSKASFSFCLSLILPLILISVLFLNKWLLLIFEI